MSDITNDENDLKQVSDKSYDNKEANDKVTDTTNKQDDWVTPNYDSKTPQYEPHHFIRSHCSESSDDDNNTQIWDVAFEPGKVDIVASCGGRYLCVFNVESGDLLLKYCHKNKHQDLYSLSWSVTEKCGNILATGSNLGEIRLYHLERDVSIYYWIDRKGISVNAVQFHSSQSNWLFTASKDSVVKLWDIGDPTPPYYTECKHQLLLSLQATGGDLYSMAWVGDTNWILVGAMEGLLAWNVPSDTLNSNKKMIEFRLPSNKRSPDRCPYVDSVCYLGNNLVATKCVGQGRIIIFQPPSLDTIPDDQSGKIEVDVNVLVQLAWRKTDNFYMNIGGLSSLGLAGCGDDRGNVWVYQLPSWLTSDVNNNNKSKRSPVNMSPLGILPWPELDDQTNSQSEDIMMDKVVFAPDGKFIVAVTNNNIVAIWKMISTPM